MNYHIIETKTVTPPHTEEERENGDVNKVEEVVIVFDETPDPSFVANRIFKSAKFVIPVNSTYIKSMGKTITKYRVTHFSPAELEEAYMYGED